MIWKKGVPYDYLAQREGPTKLLLQQKSRMPLAGLVSFILISNYSKIHFLKQKTYFSTFEKGWFPVWNVHSQKQLTHSALDMTAQMVPCWLGSWLRCNFLTAQLLNFKTWLCPKFEKPTQLDIERKLTKMVRYSGVSRFFWECVWPFRIESFFTFPPGCS